MKQSRVTCDRCGRDINPGTPDSADLYCYRDDPNQKRTDLKCELCPQCYGHFRTDFLTAHAVRMGILPKTPAHQPHSTEEKQYQSTEFEETKV